MSDLSDTIKGFYSEFILRDLLSFVTPGAIVILPSVFVLVNLDITTIQGQIHIVRTLADIPIAFWILLFGLFYLTGFGLQCFSHRISLMSKGRIDFLFPPLKYNNRFRHQSKISKITECDGKDQGQSYCEYFCLEEKCRNAKYYHCMRLPFLSHSNEIERKTHERFIVLMQASGNSSLAFGFTFLIGLSGCFRTINSCSSFIMWACFSVFCVLMGLFFYFGFSDHRQKLLDWECEVVNYYR
jgi:hypothetical protein